MTKRRSADRRPALPAIRSLSAHLGDGRRLLLLGLAFMGLDAACQLFVPVLFGRVLDAVQTDARQFVHGGWETPAVEALIVTIVFFNAAYLGHTLVLRGAARWVANLRVILFEHVQRLSLDFFARSRSGDLAARLNQDIERVEITVRLGMNLVWASTCLLLSLALMTWIDPLLAAVALGTLVVAAAAVRRAVPPLRRLNREVRDYIGSTSGTMTELLGAQALVKAFTGEGASVAAVAADATQARDRTESLVRRQFRFTDLLQVQLVFLAPFCLLFVGGWQVSRGAARVGDIAAVWVCWIRGAGALSSLTNIVPDFLAGFAAAERAAEVLAEVPEVDDPLSPRALLVGRGQIEFRSVSFRYPGRNALVLDGLDVTLGGGQRTAVVGPSGSGKSTIMGLLLRFYDPVAGSVSIDGQDLRSVTQESLRRMIGVVFQDNLLLGSTLADNLRLGMPDANDPQLWDALELAHASEFVSTWPDGLDTTLGERGVRLSGGQRQRLAIARVILKDPRIVLLDEPTSALDGDSEARVVAALEELLRGRTALIAAHRIATGRDADRIVVLRHGRVEAAGAHDELLSTSPLYRRYCRHQLLV